MSKQIEQPYLLVYRSSGWINFQTTDNKFSITERDGKVEEITILFFSTTILDKPPRITVNGMSYTMILCARPGEDLPTNCHRLEDGDNDFARTKFVYFFCTVSVDLLKV